MTLHTTDLSHFGISTYGPVEGSFETKSESGEWMWVSYEGVTNRHGELIVIKTWVDGVRSQPHSEPDWLFDEINDHIGRQS